jgi:hypothetical protein
VLLSCMIEMVTAVEVELEQHKIREIELLDRGNEENNTVSIVYDIGFQLQLDRRGHVSVLIKRLMG